MKEKKAKEIIKGCPTCKGKYSNCCNDGFCLGSHKYLEALEKAKVLEEALEHYSRGHNSMVAIKVLEQYRREK